MNVKALNLHLRKVKILSFSIFLLLSLLFLHNIFDS